eukprot:scaffold71884_cov72-Phaeocystis_antarctica.AAC.3
MRGGSSACGALMWTAARRAARRHARWRAVRRRRGCGATRRRAMRPRRWAATAACGMGLLGSAAAHHPGLPGLTLSKLLAAPRTRDEQPSRSGHSGPAVRPLRAGRGRQPRGAPPQASTCCWTSMGTPRAAAPRCSPPVTRPCAHSCSATLAGWAAGSSTTSLRTAPWRRLARRGSTRRGWCCCHASSSRQTTAASALPRRRRAAAAAAVAAAVAVARAKAAAALAPRRWC